MGSLSSQTGTARFMAPELLIEGASQATPASDVYAFGMLMLEVSVAFDVYIDPC